MSELRRNWLRHWHTILDAELGEDSTFDFESAFNDPDGDFRMHFSTWELSDEAIRRCFAVLPAGLAIADRAIEMRSRSRGDGSTIAEEEAIRLFHLGLGAFRHFSDDEDLTKPIRVQRVSRGDFVSATQYTDNVAVLLEQIAWEMSAEGSEAYSFLNETLYRLASSYDVVDYVRWPLVADRSSIEPYRPFALLGTTSRYFPLLDEDGPVLFVVADSP